jgi:hypothetical protein
VNCCVHLQSADVFGCNSAVELKGPIHTYIPMSCHEYAFQKAISQGHGRVAAWVQHGNGMVCVN